MINDPTFGCMEYKHSWVRESEVEWWEDNVNKVKITAHAYTGDGISDAQRNAFVEYEKTIKEVICSSLKNLTSFIKDNYGIAYSEKDLFDVLKPKTVLFQQDGSWGVLFDADFDIENGISLYKENTGDFKVGVQDDFL